MTISVADGVSLPEAGSGTTPTGTGYVHVTGGVQDAAAMDPLNVAATDANADVNSTAVVTGTGDAFAARDATTGTGEANASSFATSSVLGPAEVSAVATATTGNATTTRSSITGTGDSVADAIAAVNTLGNAQVQSVANTVEGNATAGNTATAGTGDASVSRGANVTVTGNASADTTAETADGNADANVNVTAAAGDAVAYKEVTTDTGEAVADTLATVTTLGNASANSAAESTIEGNATANTTATATTGNAAANLEAFATTGAAEATSYAETVTGTAEAGFSAVGGVHGAGVVAVANDATGATLEINTGDDVGAAGQFIGSDDSGFAIWQTPLVRTGTGVPTGAPGVAELPFAYDDTAVTGGFYYWNGSAWVKVATIL